MTGQTLLILITVVNFENVFTHKREKNVLDRNGGNETLLIPILKILIYQILKVFEPGFT